MSVELDRFRGFIRDGQLVSVVISSAGSMPESEGKSVPVWAQHQFSFAFTGLPPVAVYEEWPEMNELKPSEDLSTDPERNEAPGDAKKQTSISYY